MAQAYKLYDICVNCSGTGKVVIAGKDEQTCTQCNGAKILLKGYCSVNTYDIPEVPE